MAGAAIAPRRRVTGLAPVAPVAPVALLSLLLLLIALGGVAGGGSARPQHPADARTATAVLALSPVASGVDPARGSRPMPRLLAQQDRAAPSSAGAVAWATGVSLGAGRAAWWPGVPPTDHWPAGLGVRLWRGRAPPLGGTVVPVPGSHFPPATS